MQPEPREVRIIVDDREPPTMLFQVMNFAPGMWAVARPRWGDYIIIRPPRPDGYREVWGIERKTAKDLINSIKSGRVTKQLRSCQETFDKTFLLLEGPFADDGAGCVIAGNYRTKFSYKSFIAYLTARQREGIGVLVSTSPSQSAFLMAGMAMGSDMIGGNHGRACG